MLEIVMQYNRHKCKNTSKFYVK